jgi:hypothetical protein
VFASQAALDIVQYLRELDRTYPVPEIPTIEKAAETEGAVRNE